MSQAKVLYIHVTGVSSEILKNMVLAGIRATLCDNRSLDQALESPSFFYNAERERKRAKYSTVAEVVQPMVEQLNPLLDVCDLMVKPVNELTEDDVKSFRVVVASRITMKQAVQLSEWVVQSGGVFYHVDSFGLYGACAMDLGSEFRYRPEKGKELLEETGLKTHVPLSQVYQVPLHEATNRFHKNGPPSPYIVWRSLLEYVDSNQHWPNAATAEDFANHTREWIQRTSPRLLEDDDLGHDVLSVASLQQLAQVAHAELAPVCAVLGGLVGNEIIKAISGKGEPANNTLLFEDISCKAYTFLVQPKSA